MKKFYVKLTMRPIMAEPEEGILGGSIKVEKTVTVEEYKDGFATLDTPGVVDITF